MTRGREAQDRPVVAAAGAAVGAVDDTGRERRVPARPADRRRSTRRAFQGGESPADVPMVDAPSKSLESLVEHVGRYPAEAFLFLREGLGYAAERVHGPETDAHRLLYQYLTESNVDWSDLVAQYHTGLLPEPVAQAIEAAGGCDKLNRHISGRDLCWGLREFALKRWGMLARVVLESWNIKSTADFGRIVFGFIDLDMMRKQPEDRVEDFDDVYDFREAFDRTFGDDGKDHDSATDA